MWTDLELRAAVASGGTGLDLIPHPRAVQQLSGVLQQLWYEAYAAGRHAAGKQIASAVRLRKSFGLDAESEWDTWLPGDITAGSYAAQGGLATILADEGITLRGITDTTLTRIGNAIADGLERGNSVDDIARVLRSILGNADRAELIAHTETARMLTLASLDLYDAEGIRRWNWVLSAGACPLCVEQAARNPHELSDERPPGHPRCRCAVAPDMTTVNQDMGRLIDIAAGRE